MNIKLKPYDTFMFGDGKEFGLEQTFRDSTFFINPIPILGALNTIGKKHNVEFLSLAKDNELYFKMPFDVKKEKNKDLFHEGKLKEVNRIISEKELTHIVIFDTKEKIKDADYYIDQETFKKYLRGDENFTKNLQEKTCKYIKIENEIRPGIAMDHINGSVKEGALFHQIFKRFEENTYFYVKANIEELPSYLRVGGEQKLFNTKEDEDRLKYFDDIKSQIQENIEKSGLFKIILLTSSNGIPDIEGAKLIANLSKYTIYSGWFKDKPTRIFRLILEGSVFYYKLEDMSKAGDIVDRFWFKPAFYKKEYPYFDIKNSSGFGISAISFVNI